MGLATPTSSALALCRTGLSSASKRRTADGTIHSWGRGETGAIRWGPCGEESTYSRDASLGMFIKHGDEYITARAVPRHKPKSPVVSRQKKERRDAVLDADRPTRRKRVCSGSFPPYLLGWDKLGLL